MNTDKAFSMAVTFTFYNSPPFLQDNYLEVPMFNPFTVNVGNTFFDTSVKTKNILCSLYATHMKIPHLDT